MQVVGLGWAGENIAPESRWIRAKYAVSSACLGFEGSGENGVGCANYRKIADQLHVLFSFSHVERSSIQAGLGTRDSGGGGIGEESG